MFRKLHSNRDPRDTLYSALRNEFSLYIERGNQLRKGIADRYPRLIFGSMVLLLITSALAAMLMHGKPVTEQLVRSKPETSVLHSELSRVWAAGEALKQTIHLRRQVDSISGKKVLSKTDSLTLIRALDSLQHIQLSMPR